MSPALLLIAALACPAAGAQLALSTSTIAPRIPDRAARELYLSLSALSVEIGRQGQELLDLRKVYEAASDPQALSERRDRLRFELAQKLERLASGRSQNLAQGNVLALTHAMGALRPSPGTPQPTAKDFAVYDLFNEFNEELKWVYLGWRKLLDDDAALFEAAKQRAAARRFRRVLGAALLASAGVVAAFGVVLWRRRGVRLPAPAPTPSAAGEGLGGFRREGPAEQWAFGLRWPGVTKAGAAGVLELLAPELVGAGPEAERTVGHLRSATAFRHPAVRAVTSVGVSAEGVFLVAEAPAGRRLAEVLASGTALGLEAAVRAMAPVAGALDAAHAAGLVHGSLTPECICVLPDGTGTLTDFGVARALAARPGAGGGVLSPAYAAPEALEGKLVLPSDVFSFGVVLYEMLYVRLPFEGTNLAALKAERRYPAPSALLGRPAPAADAFFAGVLEPSARRRRPRVGGLAAALRTLA